MNIATSYDSWGCEFLDLETHSPPCKPKALENAIYLSVEFLTKTVDQSYASKLDEEKVSAIRTSIEREGLKKPGTLTIDHNQMYLSDGNHRFLSCTQLGYEKFPVLIKRTNGKIKVNGCKYLDIIDSLLLHLK